MRILTFAIAGLITVLPGQYYGARLCGQIDYLVGKNETLAEFPECQAFYSGLEPEKYILIRADLNGSKATAVSAFGISFAPAGFLSFILHSAGVEIYVSSMRLGLFLSPRYHF